MRIRNRLVLPALFTLAAASLALAAPSPSGLDGSRRGAGSDGALSLPGHQLAAPADSLGQAERKAALVNWLLDDLVVAGMDPGLEIELTKADRFALVNPDPNERPYRVGVVKTLAEPVDFSALDLAAGPGEQRLPLGAARIDQDGDLVWTLAVVSEGASALRLELTGLDLPPQARLFVHDLQGAAHGPFVQAGPNGDGELWTPNVFGDVAVLQLRVDGPLDRGLLDRLSFTLEAAGHSGDRFALALAQSPAKTHCPENADCVENADCGPPEPWAPLPDVQNAIAHYQFVSGAFLYLCSGGLLNNSADDGTPYFLTANHCVSRNREANTLDAFFQFTAPCGGSCGSPGSPDTSGATILRTDAEADFTFLQLNGSAPAGSYFMGWTTAPVANSNGTALHRVSHPAGAPQAYSEHSVDTSAVTCRSWPRGPWIYSRDTFGATEGGSSGSPVTNGAGEVVGQLSGACGYNTGDVCDSVSNATVDGAFAHYYPQIAQWLDPTPCSPSPEVCDNGVDDDCDGAADCADSDCSAAANCGDTGGSCGTAGNGDSCSVDADCSSCNCKRGTCRGN